MEEWSKLIILFNNLIAVIIPEKTVQYKTFTDIPYKVFSKLQLLLFVETIEKITTKLDIYRWNDCMPRLEVIIDALAAFATTNIAF